MILKLKRTPGIYLVGFMACGKSTVGRMLADELGWTFVDVDDDIEAQEHTPIPEIFETRGEEAFREIETAVIGRRVHMVQKGRPMVMSVGGGAFAREPNYELLEENGVTVWLECPLEYIEIRVAENTRRPLARDLERMRTLFHARHNAYARADFKVSSAGAPEETLRRVLELPIF